MPAVPVKNFMNEKKIKQMFTAAGNETAPLPPADFAADVLRAVRLEPTVAATPIASLFDQLNFLFPRFALAAAVVIGLCVAANFGFTSAGLPEPGDGATQWAAQFDLDEDAL